MTLFHAWFGTKRRKWLLQGDVAEEVKKLLHSIANEHGIRLLECETMPDHVHLLLEAGSPEELSRAMNLLKGASSRRLFQALPDVKLDGGTSTLWQHRYAAKPVPPSSATSVGTYIRTQWDRLEKYER